MSRRDHIEICVCIYEWVHTWRRHVTYECAYIYGLQVRSMSRGDHIDLWSICVCIYEWVHTWRRHVAYECAHLWGLQVRSVFRGNHIGLCVHIRVSVHMNEACHVWMCAQIGFAGTLCAEAITSICVCIYEWVCICMNHFTYMNVRTYGRI